MVGKSFEIKSSTAGITWLAITSFSQVRQIPEEQISCLASASALAAAARLP